MNIHDILYSTWFQKNNPSWTVKSLSEANLSWANLSGANLRGANLSGANLRGANLSKANLRGANLSEANLSEVDLSWANLRGANLSEANLSWANLSKADLSEANLRGANLRKADLSGANLNRSLNVPSLPETIIVPEGKLYVYKKTREGIVELEIPTHALRSNATSRKCRASEAIVTKLPQGYSVCHSMYDRDFVYRVGETVRPTQPFDRDRWNECGSGIHFFLTRDEAEQY